jgi:hypothetical protein
MEDFLLHFYHHSFTAEGGLKFAPSFGYFADLVSALVEGRHFLAFYGVSLEGRCYN